MPEIIVPLLLAVMTISAMGLVSLWAGTSRWHWFVRVVVVGAFLSLWLIIPAYEILAVLFVQATVVVLCLLVVRTVRTRPFRFQFAVRDLLLLTLVVAAILSVAISAPRDVWTSWSKYDVLSGWSPNTTTGFPLPWVVFILRGIGAGAITLAAAWVTLGQGASRWLVLVALCFVYPSWLLVGWLALLRASKWINTGKRPSDFSVDETVSKQGRPALTCIARIAVLLVSAPIVLPLAFVYYELATPPPILPAKLPNPNGYNDLVRAGELLVQVSELDVDAASPAGLRAFVTTNRHAFDTARRGLDRECHVPIKYTADYLDQLLPRIQGLRLLTRAFNAEGKHAEAEKRTPDAIQSYLDTVRLGRVVGNGGLIIGRLVGCAMEGIGRQGLHDMKETLTSAQCREIIDALENLAANWEPLEDVYERDRVWSVHAFGWQSRLRQLVSEWFYTDAHLIMRNTEQSDKRSHAQRWLLICELALQGHRAEHGDFPPHLAELVPGYLSAVPMDPFSGKPFIYRRQPTGYLLYSIGPDGNDDGGRPIDYNTDRGDIRLDPPSEDKPE